jgi:hypothetical protein
VESARRGRLTVRPLATGRAIVLGLWLLLVLPPIVVSATIWSLTASPNALVRGVQTNVRWELSVRDVTSLGQDRVGCLVLRLPSQLQAGAANVTATNAGSGWSAGVKNGGATVEVRADKQNGRLGSGDYVRFNVAMTGTAAGGPFTVRGDAYGDRNCDSKSRLVLLGTIERNFNVSRPATVTPSPSPPPPSKPPASAKPKPSPSPTPRDRSTPTAPPASAQPSAEPETPSPSPRPEVPTAQPSATARPSLVPTLSPRPSASPSASPAAAFSWFRPSSAGGGPVDYDRAPAGFDSTVRSLAALGSSHVWFVPALVTGVPGVLILLLVLANMLLGLSWIPGVSRLLGPDQAPPEDDQQLWWAGGRPTLD